jgi:2'-5' RNA ligase
MLRKDPGQGEEAYAAPTRRRSLRPPLSRNEATAGMHRLFFAQEPDERARARIAAFATSLRQVEGGAGWTDPARFHVTLAFLGSWESYPQSEATRAIAAARGLEAAPFTVRLERLDSFRGPRSPWFLAAAASLPLRALAADLRDRLVAAGIAHDPKPFVPHLTVRRAREPVPARPLPPIEWVCGDFVLLHGEDGAPAYRTLARYPLGERVA